MSSRASRELVRRCITIAALAASALALRADPIPVRQPQGSLLGFLVLRSPEGKILADGELSQTIRRGLVVARITFHFRDGSLDDETSVYSQRGHFHLISDHHVQKGPTFPHPLDLAVEVATGQVTSRTTDKDGKEKVTQDHLNLAPDLSSNILLLTEIMNLPPAASATVSMLAPTPKPRIIKANITPGAEDTASAGTIHRKATDYRIKIELGGVAGVVAPIVGKAPADTHIWVIAGEAPTFVRQQGQLFEGGPIWTIEQTSPTLASSAH